MDFLSSIGQLLQFLSISPKLQKTLSSMMPAVFAFAYVFFNTSYFNVVKSLALYGKKVKSEMHSSF